MPTRFYYFSKIFVTIFSLILIFIGITLIILDFTLFNFDKIIPNDDYIKGGTIITKIIFSLGIIGIIFGIMGFFGAKKENK